ncbi:MAG: hypothetical protein DCC73_08100 [Proteobacteria bacterium]|nr:MAG: hypothetical protein DCC73_08100 [Pseudomonadota bacterium]
MRRHRGTRSRLAAAVTAAAALILASPAAGARTIGGFEDVANMAHDMVEGLWPDDLAVPGLSARIGVGGLYAPEYRGASDNEWTLAPIIRLQYKDRITFSGQKLKVRAHRGEHWGVGGFIRYRFGRDEKDRPVLQGLGDIGDTWEIGPFVEYRTGPARFTVELRPGLQNSQGLTTYLEAATGIYKSERWRVQGLAYLLWGNKENLRTHFGVSEEQAAASTYGLPVYRPNSGLVETRLAIGAEYFLSEKIQIGQFISYGWFLDEAASSPIVKAGSKDQFTAGAGLIFSF